MKNSYITHITLPKVEVLLYVASRNIVVRRCHINVKLASVSFKMADVNAECFKEKIDSFKRRQKRQKYARKRIQHGFEEKIDKSLPRVMPNCDPRDRIVHPIHKLMIDYKSLT